MLKRIHLLSFLLVFVLFLSGCGKTTESGESDISEFPEDFAYTVLVTINPEMKLYMNESDKILAVEYLNDDAKAAYSDKEIIGMTLEDGLAGIVETAIDKEYLKDGRSITLELDEVKTDSGDKDTVLSSADNAIKAVLTEKNITAKVVIATDDETTEPISDAPSTTQPLVTQPVITQPVTISPTISKEPTVRICSSCGGSGECQGCHGGNDACAACNGVGNEVCQNCDANGLQSCPNRHDCINGKCNCPNCQGTGSATCSNCGGSGINQDDGTSVCPVCNGIGKQTCLICDGKGYEICNICSGKGKVSCEICNGTHTWVCTHCKGAGTTKDCPECNGSFICIACNGTGKQQEE